MNLKLFWTWFLIWLLFQLALAIELAWFMLLLKYLPYLLELWQ